MLVADMMKRTNDRSLEKRPNAFGGVDMHVAPYPLFNRVVDGFVLGGLGRDPIVSGPVVRIDRFGVVRDVLVKERVKLLSRPIRDDLQSNASVPFDSDSDFSFVASEPAASSLGLAADERLIRFHNVVKLWGIVVRFCHRFAYSMAEIPRGLVRYADHSLNLVSRYALSALTHHVDGHEPLVKRQVAVVKHGSRLDREVMRAIAAFVLVAVVDWIRIKATALRAKRAVWPAKLFKQVAALIFGAESLHQFNDRNRGTRLGSLGLPWFSFSSSSSHERML